jgi:tetratricopeptide (TPR) repeat protein
MTPLDLSFATVLTGAGISMPAPSVLPSGNTLASVAWRLLNHELGALSSEAIDQVGRRFWGDDSIRLEQLVDVMTTGVDLQVLVSVYDAVAGAEFNYVHARLIELNPRHLITVNMDTMLEDARDSLHRVQPITHLHGVHSDPQSIVTTISQYLEHLPDRLRNELGAALAGQRVLVSGYSGRDRDIMPLLREFAPADITWLVYPLADEDPTKTRDDEVEPEVRDLLDHLAATIGVSHVHEIRTRTEDFLDGILPPAAGSTADRRTRLSERPAAPSVWPLPPSAIARFTGVPRWRRILAVAAVLRDLGMTETMLGVLSESRIPRTEPEVRIAARKLRGRGLKRMDRPRRALSAFLLPIGGVRYSRQLRAMGNEVSSTLTSAGFPRTARRVDLKIIELGATKGGEFSRAAVFAQGRMAQRYSAAGDLVRAAAAFEAVLQEASNRRVLGLGAWVDQWTWFADLHKLRGDIDKANAALSEATQEYPYADASQRTMIAWKSAEVALVSEGPTPDVLNRLAAVCARSEESSDSSAFFWSRASLVGAIAPTDRGEAHRLVGALRSAGVHRADQRLFLELQAAELARVEGDPSACHRSIRRALRIERDRRQLPDGTASGRLAAQLISAKVSAAAAVSDAERAVVGADLQAIVDAMESFGAHLPAAHARVVLAFVRNDPVEEAVVN